MPGPSKTLVSDNGTVIDIFPDRVEVITRSGDEVILVGEFQFVNFVKRLLEAGNEAFGTSFGLRE